MTAITIYNMDQVFYHLQRKLQKLYVRLRIGILLCLLGVVSLLITDVVGHVLNRKSFVNIIFPSTVTVSTYPSLNIHWEVLIPPTLILSTT